MAKAKKKKTVKKKTSKKKVAKKKKTTKKKTSKKKATKKKATKKKTNKKKAVKKAAKKKTSKKKAAKKKTVKKKTSKKKAAKKKATKKKISKKKATKKKATTKKAAKKKTAKKKATKKKAVKKSTKKKTNTKKKKTTAKKSSSKVERKSEKEDIPEELELKDNEVKAKLKKEDKENIDELEAAIQSRIVDLREYFSWKDIEGAIHSLDLFIPENDECMESGCDNIRSSGMYCRYHYISNWKDINQKKEILKEGKLQAYIEELVSKYPSVYIQALVEDLSDPRDFNKVLTELNIVDSDFEEDFDGVDDDDDSDLDVETRDFSISRASIEDDD